MPLILPLPFGVGEKGELMYYKTEDAPEEIKPVLKSGRIDLNGRYELINFSTDLLKKTQKYLIETGKYVSLKREIDKEISLRKSSDSKCDEKRKWFTPLWWAVMSLYGKGEMDMNAPETQDLLFEIKHEWIYNCGGHKG